jgi:hypothetical protein
MKVRVFLEALRSNKKGKYKMSFWFQPTRTGNIEQDLHSTDIEFLRKKLGTEYVTFGNKGIASVFCDILPKFDNLVNKWVSPEQLIEWGNFLLKLDKFFHFHLNEKEYNGCEIYWYGKLFIEIGQRGIGLTLSW